MLQAQKQEAGGDGMLDVEAVNWSQLRKYDIFQQMLRAAASSPTSQVCAKPGSLLALTHLVCLGA